MSPPPPKGPPAGPNVGDGTDDDDIEVRFVQPYEAAKRYVCPGCNRDIPAGTGHVVAVPRSAPDDRRHWHRGCWNSRHRRPPGRAR